MIRIARLVRVTLPAILLVLWGCAGKSKPVSTIPQASPPPAVQAESQPLVVKKEPPPKETQPSPTQEDLTGEPVDVNGSEDKSEVPSLLEEALSATQDAQSALDRGDFDGALVRLDEAYGLLLKANIAPDSPLSQEKNDLRILIAQRIQQIYASRLSPVGDNNKTIPLLENQWIQKEILSFQTKERRYFEESYRRSGLYREMILDELRKAGLPDQISWLPIIESGFKVRALSRARALGMWQFISSTGYRFGLKRDKYVDERMDPIKSTQAAIRYLVELHDFFGDWTTALASYNCGEFRVQNVIRSQRIDYLDNFWDLFNNLPYETARFVPRFIAALLIIENPEKYGITLPQPDPPLRWETVTLSQPVKLASLSATLGLDPLVLPLLNPELRFDSTPNYDYALKVPLGCADKALAALPSLPRWIPPEAVYSWHYVRSGETLGSIARRYRTTVSAIARFNGLRSTRLIYPGQRLKIPGKGGISPNEAEAAAVPPFQPGDKVTYTVKSGDTLFQIARLFGTTVDRIKTDNNLPHDLLAVGQNLVIRTGQD